MLKIRLQGTTKDIKWFLKMLARDKRIIANKPSEPMAIKGSQKYKRAYTEILQYCLMQQVHIMGIYVWKCCRIDINRVVKTFGYCVQKFEERLLVL